MDQKLAIPTGYDGYFEILSQNGRAVKCIENVPELARRFPDSVLVRENFKALVSKSDDLNALAVAITTIPRWVVHTPLNSALFFS